MIENEVKKKSETYFTIDSCLALLFTWQSHFYLYRLDPGLGSLDSRSQLIERLVDPHPVGTIFCVFSPTVFA